jgi:DNA-directed RNA polymerase specialized sigma24 family protein
MPDDPQEETPMSPEGSVSRLLDPLQQGDSLAVQQLWERYFQRLVSLARVRLRTLSRRMADEEDVALSAFDSFCRNAEQGRFPQLADRDSLWRLLVVITARKAARLVRDEGRQKRGGEATVLFGGADASSEDGLLEQALSREPTPDLAAQLAEEIQRLLDLLEDAELTQVALWRMEGFSVEEIAVRLDCAPRSVKRKLHLIRAVWEKEMGS